MIINGIDWKLNKSSDLSNKIWGNCDYSQHSITINQDLCPQEQLKSVIHEIIHAYVYSYGFTINKAENERLCEFIAMNFFTIQDLINKATEEINK